MQYLVWAVLALVAYSLVPIFVKVATAEMPSDVTLLVANGILVLSVGLLVAVTDTSVRPYLEGPPLWYAVGAGIALTVGIVSYYRALAGGPVSIVVPIFGMFIAISSVLGIAFLDEPLTARKVAGIAFAVLAVYLTSVE